MKIDSKIIPKAIGKALSGKNAHAANRNIFEGLDWKLAGTRPARAPHSVYQLLRHMTFWQDWVVTWMEGRKPPIPKHAAESWPKDPAPANRAEWDEAVGSFRKGLANLELMRARRI